MLITQAENVKNKLDVGNSFAEKGGKQHNVMKARETFYEGVTVTSVSLNYVNSSCSSNQSAKVTNSKKSCLGQHFAKIRVLVRLTHQCPSEK